MRNAVLGVSLAVVLSCGGGAALAGPAIGFKTALDNCQNSKLVLDVRIEACTSIIQSDLLPRKQVADMYFIRGNAFAENHKNKEALSDYNKALELKPDFPQALNNRAILESQSAASESPGTASSQPTAQGEKSAPQE